MASLQKYAGRGKHEGKTFYRIQPVLPNGNRVTIRLGTGSKNAEKACKAISDLIDSHNANVEPAATTKAWLADTVERSIATTLLNHELIDALPPRLDESQRQVTTTTLCDRFIRDFSAGKSPGTVTTYNQSKQTLIEHFGDREVELITASDAREFWTWMITDRKLAPNTAKMRLRNVRAAFELAVESGLITKNPFKAKGLSTSQTAANKTYVPIKTIAKIIQHCPTAEWRVFFQLVRTIPMRIPSEIQELTWNDIDVDANTILVHSPKTRHIGKAARLVPIFEHLRQPLNDLYHAAEDGEEYVFPRLRKLSNVNKMANDILDKAKVKSWPRLFNSIRASAETDLMDSHGLRLACQWAGNSASTAMSNYALVRNTDFDDSGKQKADAYSDARNPFDAQCAAEPASAVKQPTRQNAGNGVPASLVESQRDTKKVPAGL